MRLSKIFLFILSSFFYVSCVTPACVQANRGLVESLKYFRIAYVNFCWGNEANPEKGDTIYISKKGEAYYLEFTPFVDTVHNLLQNILGDTIDIQTYKHHLHLRTATGKILKKYKVEPFEKINIKGRTWFVLWDNYQSTDDDFKKQICQPRCVPANNNYRNIISYNCCKCNKRLKLIRKTKAK